MSINISKHLLLVCHLNYHSCSKKAKKKIGKKAFVQKKLPQLISLTVRALLSKENSRMIALEPADTRTSGRVLPSPLTTACSHTSLLTCSVQAQHFWGTCIQSMTIYEHARKYP